ncbi:MAG TPA: D-sedoheptulose 7-phosphate isomerase [Deltaproteobacteria bacterium]|jgi:D-sedoheptulose 7-phosphate isomerase|nr:D-sedoheptulose 7-phosphate isomerase [Deltaproteobacteria bacterium]HOI07929.1 D-sedoheptulose 7-phosphate isomerase [Deltaproteobacteria bacterium]
MEDRIRAIIQESVELHGRISPLVPRIKQAAELMCAALARGGKVMFAGNGGSAADAQHLAAELVNRFRLERAPLAGLALTTDTSVLTSIANDYSFDELFSKQVRALGREGDVLVGLSTSGGSRNIVRAVEEARAMGITTIGLTGEAGAIRQMVDCALAVPSGITARVQEVHILIGHILCDIVEEESLRFV